MDLDPVGWFHGRRRDELLILFGVTIVVVTIAGSAIAAPSLTKEGTGDRTTVVGIQGGGTGWHERGAVIQYEESSISWQATAADSYFDATRLDNGSFIVGFMDVNQRDCGPYEPPCARTGYHVIDPAGGTPEVVANYSFPVRSAKNSEVHVAAPLDDGGVLLADMDRERVFIVNDGEVVWQWNASSMYDAPADPTTTDWLHINDVDVIGENRYLVSVRNANQLVVIERGSGVVEVINEDTDDTNDDACRRPGQLRDTDGDGDVQCGNPAILNHQHNPQWLGNGAILVADSDNDRIVELHRQPNGSWSPAWSVGGAGGVRFQWPRDADRLRNGNTLVTDTLNQRIVEIDETGEVIWAVRTDEIPYEADRLPEGETTRAVRYEGGEVTGPTGGVPVLSTLLVGLRAVYSGVPFWFRELQLGLTIVAVGLMIAGALDRLRGQFRR